MNSIKNVSRLAALMESQIQHSKRLMSSDAREASLAKFRAKQVKFQVEDGKPIHLKGGAFDVFLYRLTMGLSLVGVGMGIHLVYELSCPKEN